MVELLKEHSIPGCALWAKMGLGKTIITLTAIVDLINDFDLRRTLVVAPLRVARKTWPDEIAKWEHVSHLRVSRIIGTEEQRLRGMCARADVYVINRENLTWLVEQHFNRVTRKFRGGTKEVMGDKQIRPWIWDTVIIDESSSFKDHNTIRFKRMKRARKLFDRLIELTGTPSSNGLINLWAQLYLIDQGKRLGTTITAYRDKWFHKPDWGFKWIPKESLADDPETGKEIVVPWAADQIMARVSDVCFSLRSEDYLDLPDIVYRSQKAYLSKEELAQYRELEKTAVAEIADEEITAINAGALSGKLVQLANGAVYTKHPEWVEFHSKKLDVMEELLGVATTPVILVYYYKHDLERITARLNKMKANWRKLDTEQDEDDWNAGKIDVLVLHPESAGHGLNLQESGSELIIWFGLTFNLEHYQQVIARLGGGHRLKGRSLVVQHIVADGTRDEDVLEILADKDATQEKLMDYVKVLAEKP